MSKKFIKLKDKYGNTLYPSAYKDDLDQVIRKTYLTKTGKDSYIYKAWVETFETSEGTIIQKLVLVNRSDPDHPIEFYSGSLNNINAPELLKDNNTTDNVNYNINEHNYEEYIKLCIDQINELKQRVKELEDAK